MNVSLIGMMGSGKSTIGKLLAEKTGMSFVDVDGIIEAERGMNVAEIFREFGEEEFRRLEKEALALLSGKDNLVISAGGGLAADEKNMTRLKELGPVIWLYASTEETLKRTAESGNRPLLDVKQPAERLESLLKTREKHYCRADLRIDTTGRTPDEVTGDVFKFLEENKPWRM